MSLHRRKIKFVYSFEIIRIVCLFRSFEIKIFNGKEEYMERNLKHTIDNMNYAVSCRQVGFNYIGIGNFDPTCNRKIVLFW